MPKRQAQQEKNDKIFEKKKINDQEKVIDENESDLSWEDEFEDEYESEEIVNEQEDEVIEEKQHQNNKTKKVGFVENMEEEAPQKQSLQIRKSKKQKQKEKTPYMDSNKNLHEDEELEFDNRAYEMLHRANFEWPFLSFDIITEHNNLLKMDNYPYDITFVSGTQSSQANKNFIYLTQMGSLKKTINDDDSVDSDQDNNDNPIINLESVPVNQSINRIRSMNQTPIVATQNENGQVQIYNLQQKYDSLKSNQPKKFVSKKKQKCLEKVSDFQNDQEGFALNWNHLAKGQLASGSMDGKIFLYNANQNFSSWQKSQHPYQFHTQSVEDIQFSPNEEFAFASCSVDKSIKICDTRANLKNQAQINVNNAHTADVNVISWSKSNPRLLASGGDDCYFKVWDLRYIKNGALNEILWHSEQITSICFQPNEESVVTVSSADNRLSVWDFSVENDDTQMDEEIPDQMMFLHQGLDNIKEIMYHPNYYEMILATGSNGFHVFKPAINDAAVSSSSDEEQDNKPNQIDEKELNKYFNDMKLN